jgi:small subunit ribosomal protein S16
MPVVIRLMRAGAKKRPFYRMVAADSRRQRDGRFLEILGHYNPIAQPFELVVHKDKVEQWLSKGAQPSEQAASLLRSLGIALRKQAAPRAEKSAAPAAKSAKKKVRAKPRVTTERKQKAKALRAKRKAAGVQAKPAAKKA